MAQPQGRGDHPFAPPRDGARQEPPFETYVFPVEIEAVKSRRAHIRDKGGERARDRTRSPLTGLALSGGGIRSASFGLGALQALHVQYGIEGVDYLSSVSGGGYIGCSLTNSLQADGTFPFTDPKNYEDTSPVGHIRNYSNYLMPRGLLDAITAIGIIGRGFVANVLILLPVLFFVVGLTLTVFPTVESLNEPKFLFWDLGGLYSAVADWLYSLGFSVSKPHLGLNGFWFTAILGVVNVVFLVLWALGKSIAARNPGFMAAARLRKPGDSAELNGIVVTIAKGLFFATALSLFFELQPFILRAMAGVPAADGRATGGCGASFLAIDCFGRIVRDWAQWIMVALAPLGAILAFFSKYLGDVVAATTRTPGWRAWVKKIWAKASLWLAAIIVPLFLWLLYLSLTSFGLDHPEAKSLYLILSLGALALALFVDPNATSLHRLYRDRLSKAFLFNPNPRVRDASNELIAVDPKLAGIDTDLCPYPIINAALNIQGSRYANKRGRDADFFVFTPEFTGSDATGYVGTARMEKEEEVLDLGTAMAISGAAFSSNMGAQTVRPLAFTLAFLNLRLGFWLRNPRFVRGMRSLASRIFDIRGFLLFKEMFSFITEKSPTVYLTDGGHLENLGAYSLMKRGCEVIIVIDAEADPTVSFPSFLTLERHARIDLGAIIDLPWQPIKDQCAKINAAFDRAGAGASAKPDGAAEDPFAIPCLPGPHCAGGEIQYGPHRTGVLLYVKASLSGDEGDYILDYKRRFRDFPHETTGDQFFTEEQLEVYRALGFHIVKGLCDGTVPFAVRPAPNETEDQARRRILDKVKSAMLGSPVVKR